MIINLKVISKTMTYQMKISHHKIVACIYACFGIFENKANGVILRQIQVFKNSEQVIITFSRDKETIEAKIERIRG